MNSVDDAGGRILDELEREGVADDTLVVITSDHGEALSDGFEDAHGNDLFGDVQNHVPLAIVDPRRAGRASRVVTSLSRDVDVAPTLDELLGLGTPSDVDGTSLVPDMRGQPELRRLVFGETGLWLAPGFGTQPTWRIPYPGLLELLELDAAHGDSLQLQRAFDIRTTFAKHRSVFDGEHKLIYAPGPSGPKYLLYDTTQDPQNLHNLAEEEPALRDRLLGELWRWMLEDPTMERRHGFLAPRGARIPEVDDGGALVSAPTP